MTHANDRFSSGDIRDRLALEALSKLSSYFVSKPDFTLLINTLLLIINGQFAVLSAFIAIGELDDLPEGNGFVATGRFYDNPFLAESFRAWQTARYPFTAPRASTVDELIESCSSPDVISRLREQGVNVLAPIMHDDRIIGTIGLGQKANGRPLQASEMALIEVMANTVAPLVINALYFQRINALSEWHLAVLNSVTQGVFVFDHQFRLQTINSTAMRLLDTLLDDHAGLDRRLGQSIESVFPNNVFPNRFIRGQGSDRKTSRIVSRKVVVRRPDKDYVFDLRVVNVTPELGAEGHTVVTLEDITAQAEMEAWLFELQKSTDRGNLVSEIAHELNNFLSVFSGGIEVATHSLETDDLDRAADVLKRMMSETGRLADFSDKLMNRPETPEEITTIQLNELIDTILAFVSLQRRVSNVTISKDLQADLPMVTIDSGAFGQVLINLIHNACDAIAACDRTDGNIRVTTETHGSDVWLTIADNGVGMPPDVLERAFSERQTTKPNGHGHGLVTCGKIINRYGGRISAESTQGEGTSIAIVIPGSRAQSKTSQARLHVNS